MSWMLLESAVFYAYAPQDHIIVQLLNWMCHIVQIYFGDDNTFFFWSVN